MEREGDAFVVGDGQSGGLQCGMTGRRVVVLLGCVGIDWSFVSLASKVYDYGRGCNKVFLDARVNFWLVPISISHSQGVQKGTR